MNEKIKPQIGKQIQEKCEFKKNVNKMWNTVHRSLKEAIPHLCMEE